jgi:hypothetical protein
MKKHMTLAGAAALALTLGGGAAAAQAKTATTHHPSKKATTVVAGHSSRDYDLVSWVAPWLIPGPSETSSPDLGLLTDLVETVLGVGGLLTGG